jgi:hypothetical protein
MQRLNNLIVVVGLSMVGSAAAMGTPEEPQNAALQYWVAFALCPRENSTLSRATTDDEKLGFGVPVSQELAQYFRGDGERALLHLHRGAKLSTCDWATDQRLDGPKVAAPYHKNAHALARVALLRARWRFEHGDWDGGIEDVIATMVLGRHIGRGKICVTIHFGCMLETMATGTLAFYLPRMPEKARERLARELELLPPFTSMREVVLYYQNNIDWAIDNFKRAEKEGRLLELIVSLMGEEEAKKVLEMAKDAEGLCKLAEAGRPLARQIAEALSLRADKYDRLFKERFAPQLDANPVAAMLGTDYEHARGEESTANCRLVLLKTALDVLRRGKSALNDHPDPYGDGPFAYAEIDGGFELGSALVYGNRQIRMRFGVPGASLLVPVKAL